MPVRLGRANSLRIPWDQPFNVGIYSEAAKPIYEADRHAKKELKKHIRGVRPIEQTLEHRQDPEAEVIRGYCLAVHKVVMSHGIKRFTGCSAGPATGRTI